MLRFFALYGLYKFTANYILPAFIGFYRHFLRPRRNLSYRYGVDSWALVTGATDGIGEQLCYQLAKSGFNIVLIGRSDEKLLAVSNIL